MTTMKRYAVFVLGVVAASVAWQGAEAKENKTDRKNAQAIDTEKVTAAAQSCDLPTLKALIASGVDVSATDADGYDALSRASLNRKTWFGLWKKAQGNPEYLTLKCPSAVVALKDGGADPWKAAFYQNPRLDEHRPQMIAVLRVEDNREKKGESEKIMRDMTDGVEIQLRGNTKQLSHLGYPILKLNEVRQKLLLSGFSAEDTVAPDRAKACTALAADSVFEASLEDFRTRSIGIEDVTGMRMKFTLTDCRTGELLWRSDQNVKLARGFLVKAFGNKVKEMVTGEFGGGINFPPYDKRKK